MYRKLVPYDEKGFGVVDKVALRRTAKRLLELIPSVSDDDSFGIHSRLVPAIERAVAGLIDVPIEDERQLVDGRFTYESIEGILPSVFTREFVSAYADFCVTALALPLDPPEIEFVDGRQFAWMEFEEDGDWPKMVKHP